MDNSVHQARWLIWPVLSLAVGIFVIGTALG